MASKDPAALLSLHSYDSFLGPLKDDRRVASMSLPTSTCSERFMQFRASCSRRFSFRK